jgi:hypothetical protein
MSEIQVWGKITAILEVAKQITDRCAGGGARARRRRAAARDRNQRRAAGVRARAGAAAVGARRRRRRRGQGGAVTAPGGARTGSARQRGGNDCHNVLDRQRESRHESVAGASASLSSLSSLASLNHPVDSRSRKPLRASTASRDSSGSPVTKPVG